jgi:hypothetical protein
MQSNIPSKKHHLCFQQLLVVPVHQSALETTHNSLPSLTTGIIERVVLVPLEYQHHSVPYQNRQKGWLYV